MAAYATSVDLVARYDEALIQDLCSDSGTPEVALASNAICTAALLSSSGRVEGACTVAGMYTPTQLAALTGNGLGLLKELVCDLAFVRLARRRPGKFADEILGAIVKETEDFLDRLRKGERLFYIEDAGQVEAGQASVDGPTAIDFTRLNLITSRTRNFYPAVAGRLPIGRGG